MLRTVHTFFLTVAFSVAPCTVSLGCAEILTRDDAIRIGLERNPGIIAAWNEWEAARAKLLQARALPDPEFELEYEELPGSLNLGSFGERNLGIVQTIPFPVKWMLHNRAAGQHTEAVRNSTFEVKKLEVRTAIKVLFDRILLGKTILVYVEQNLELTKAFQAKTKVRFNAGDVSMLDVLRAEVELGRAQSRVTTAKNDLSIFGAELNTMLARDTQSSFDVSGELVFRPLDIELESMKKTALENRPDLNGAEKSFEESQTLKKLAVTSIVPDMNVGAFRQTLRDTAGREGYWHLSVGFDIPLWAMVRRRGEIAEAAAEVGRSNALKQSLRNQALLEVENAYRNLKSLEEQVELYREKTLDAVEKSYEMANRSYQEGKATYLELLEAQRILTETRIEYAEILFRYSSELSILERSVGKDIDELSHTR